MLLNLDVADDIVNTMSCLHETVLAIEAEGNSSVGQGYQTQLNHTGRWGRSSFDITREKLSFLLEQGFKVKECSNLLGVGQWNIEKRMSSFGLSVSGERYSVLFYSSDCILLHNPVLTISFSDSTENSCYLYPADKDKCFCHFNGLWGSDCRFKAPPQRACFPGYSYMLHCRLINFIHLISLQKYWQVYKPPHKLSFGHHTSLVCQEAVPLDTPVITYDTQLINGINSINSIILWL